MRGLSLTQPWATAVALLLKGWETRSWYTNYRGELALHAAKGFPGWAKEFAVEEMTIGRIPKQQLPLGAVIAVCELTQVKRTQDLVGEISAVEKMYGDYSEGRWAFKLEKVRVLKNPVPVRGALGLWPVEWELHRAISAELKEVA